MSPRVLKPDRGLIAILLALSLLAAATSPDGATASREPFFAPSPHGPYPLGDSPTAILRGRFDQTGKGYDNLLVGYAGASKAQLFSIRRRGLIELGSFLAPIGQSAFAGDPNSQIAILSAGNNQARLFVRDSDFFRSRLHPTATVRTGVDPVAAVIDNFVPTPVDDGLDMAVVNRGSDNLSMYAGEYPGNLELVGTVPLDPEPTAAAGHECCVPLLYVTSAGWDTVTLLSDYQSGEFRLRRSFPTGDRPSALAIADFVEGDYKDEEIAVANRGSDTVTILDSPDDTYDFKRIGSYRVGREPVAISPVNIDEIHGPDLAVVNSGSDDVSILLNDGKGGFVPGGTFPVGRHPVALAATNFNYAFSPDLAVVNRGSDDLTVLLRHPAGTCQGRDARELTGTSGEDSLRGGRGPDQLSGLAGNDEIAGSTSADCLHGGGGEDTIRGATGNDWITTRDGERDTVFCGPGEDDTALVDRQDSVSSCEVTRVG